MFSLYDHEKPFDLTTGASFHVLSAILKWELLTIVLAFKTLTNTLYLYSYGVKNLNIYTDTVNICGFRPKP